MTEDEAKTKACPFSMTSGGRGQNCLGSECAAWRCHDLIRDDGVWRPVERGLYLGTWRKLQDGDAPQGYCGLASKP